MNFWALLLSVFALALPARGLGLGLGRSPVVRSLSGTRLEMSPVTGRGGKGKGDVVFIDSSYNVAAGFWVATALSVAASNVLAAVPFGALALLLTRQTPRVAFAFDNEAMEVFIKNADGTFGQRENFAVGGQNRWSYKSFIKWDFFPSRALPIFMYFYENQTPGSDSVKGQFHLFPVILDSEALLANLLKNVGEK